MQIGMVGLGRMGGNMAERLLRGGHHVTVFDASASAVVASAAKGAEAAASLEDVVKRLKAPRTFWVMVPAGEVTENTVAALTGLLSKGDTLIDGGNSNYKESQRRALTAAAVGVDFLDVGTSGGIWGLENGYCLTVGGSKAAFERNLPVFQTLAPGDNHGFLYAGPSGAGHYVKMVHNGIEYGMMQAFAEGFELLAAKKELNLDLAAVAENWRYSSVVRSWLLDLTAAALKEDAGLESLTSYVDDSGEGRWTVQESVDLAVPAPVITAALQARFRSRQENPLGGRVLAAMRQKFGGHAVKKAL
ncbi:MAG: decarboxylating 6-phosphogluconate dehydrogenase [Dehalococcoidia bacterium]|nr:decarboxylating 6-phosphogluconate dehydrogenase [Dehalococcoidia bacterium]MSQ35352.1 decarboxylating 6-phosphogluconate dehydrogenase [Dehalococcoidia bacterium]